MMNKCYHYAKKLKKIRRKAYGKVFFGNSERKFRTTFFVGLEQTECRLPLILLWVPVSAHTMVGLRVSSATATSLQ